MVISLSDTRGIRGVEDVIKALVDKGLNVWEAIKEYEQAHGTLTDTCKYNVIWYNDHKWNKEAK